MLHILFLSPHSDPQANLGELDSGGQCVYEHELALALSRLPDFKVTTFCRQNYFRPDESLINSSYKIVRITCGERAQIRKEEIERVLPEFYATVIQYLKSIDTDDIYILHGHYWDGAYASLGLKSKWGSRLPCIWTPHSLGSIKRRKFPGARNEWAYEFIPRQCWEGYISHVSDFVIVSTQEEKNGILRDYAVDEAKIKIIPPGVDVLQFQRERELNARAKLGLPTTGKLLLCLGRMVRTKGYHRSIQAFASLKKRYTQPIYLAVYGGSQIPIDREEIEYKQELQDLIHRLQLQDSIFFRPALPHNKIASLYKATDVFLMSSQHEPFGLVTIEAMACGIPVVAERSGGSVNIITHNRDGILTSFSDPDRAASDIVSLLKDKDFYERISQTAIRHVKRDYDWRQKSEDFAQVYRQISRSVEKDEFQEHLTNQYFLRQHFHA